MNEEQLIEAINRSMRETELCKTRRPLDCVAKLFEMYQELTMPQAAKN